MGLFFNDYSSTMDIAAVLLALTIIILTYYHHAYQYWSKRGVPYLKPQFPLGNVTIWLPQGLGIGTTAKEFYDVLKKKTLPLHGHQQAKNGNSYNSFGGIYTVTQPQFVPLDPSLIKDILVTDFQYFVDRGTYHNAKHDPISEHLFTIDSPKWKPLRTRLTPTFTSGKMKMMFNSIVECSEYMKEALDKYAANNEPISVKNMMRSFTIDVIGICAFGVTCNSFRYPDAEFKRMAIRLFELNLWERIKRFFMVYLPTLALWLGLSSFKPDVSGFFRGMVQSTVRYREENNAKRNDFLQLLIDLKNKEDDVDVKFTMDEIAAQVVLFFVAGFDTSSSAMTFALYELASNEEIQQRVRQEIEDVLSENDNKISYDSLKQMKYLTQVIEETLRMYPPLVALHRRCVKDYTLRDHKDVTIEKNTPILISTLGLHLDPDHFPNPEQFDPDRFSDENRKNIKPFTYLPFGDGPRNCIGLRFGMMQAKIGIIQVIRHFKLTVNSSTKPVILDPNVFLLKTLDPIYLNVQKI